MKTLLFFYVFVCFASEIELPSKIRDYYKSNKLDREFYELVNLMSSRNLSQITNDRFKISLGTLLFRNRSKWSLDKTELQEAQNLFLREEKNQRAPVRIDISSDSVSKKPVQTLSLATRKRLERKQTVASFHKFVVPDQFVSRIAFDDIVGGVPEEFHDVINTLMDDPDYRSVNVRKPRGICLQGPPGVGKTFMAKSLPGELAKRGKNTAYIYMSGSDFIRENVGSGSNNFEKLMMQVNELKKHADYVFVFIDEIDSIASDREKSHRETAHTLNSVLATLNGRYENDDNVLFIFATNRPQSLDEAFLRAGRCDIIINIGLPDSKKREALFRYYMKNRQLDLGLPVKLNITPKSYTETVDVSICVDPLLSVIPDLLKGTEKFNCADMEKCVNDAAIKAARRAKACREVSDHPEKIECAINEQDLTSSIEELKPRSKMPLELQMMYS